eukprot:NODE_31_length_37178_cov_0.413576.p11 type:complete len:303 gc:universal NODE_31_length_37178_cov_0.413576:32027-31119(-)
MKLDRYLWVWSTSTILEDSNKISAFISDCVIYDITNVFLYIKPEFYKSKQTQLASFLTKLNKSNIKSWGLDGDRGYLSDAAGPQALYSTVNNLISYNSKMPKSSRFYGFQTDVEPMDQDSYTTFHNDIPDSKLSSKSGGTWYQTQKDDRNMLMKNWLSIHDTLRIKLHNNNLKLGAALPYWLDNYWGEPIRTTYNGNYLEVFSHFASILDEIFVMSYNTYTDNVVARMDGKLKVGDSKNVKICSGVETNAGVAEYVSYADTPGKNSKSVVLSDISILEIRLGNHTSYSGVCIHDYNGFVALK